MARPPRRSLTVTRQALELCRRYPHAERPTVRADRLRWIVKLQPTPFSVTYTVRVNHVTGHRPRVIIVDPALHAPEGRKLQHVFPGDELCLYYDEFDARVDLLADTIVPWISEWLYFYEVWLTTDEWHGGGIHPTTETKSRRRR